MDIEKLMKSLDNEDNEKLLNLTTLKIQQLNLSVLKELELTREQTLDLLKKLNRYIYVDEINELKYGTYMRWVPLNNPEKIALTRGGVFCDVKITENGIMIICKNIGRKCSHFQVKMDECLVFRKLTDQEQVLLSALDHLSK